MSVRKISLMRPLTALFLAVVMTIAPAAASVNADAAEETAVSAAENAEAADAAAFSEAWNQLSGALLEVYTAAVQDNSIDYNDISLPSYRLSVNPATLRLLNFASESLIKTDLSWIEELGVDLIPSIQTKQQPYYSGGYYPGTASMPEIEAVVPGLTAVLHVNGKEILTSDLYVDDRAQGFFVSLPELVSGVQFVNLFNVYQQFYRNLRSSGLRLEPSSGAGALLRTPKDLSRLLPDEKLMGMILETAGEAAEYYKPLSSEETVFTAKETAEDVTSYTGTIAARDGLSLLLKLLERINEDDALRDALISYINQAYDAYSTNLIIQGLTMQAGLYRMIGGMSLQYIADQARVAAAVITGDWKFRREELNSRDESVTEEPDFYHEDTESEAEDVYHPEDIQAVPGRTYTWEEYEDLPYDNFTLMRKGIVNGEVILTENRSLGDNLYIVYKAGYDELTDEINKLYYSVDKDISIQITTGFNQAGKLAGLGIAPAYRGQEAVRADLCWPAGEGGQGLKFTVSEEGQELASAVLDSRITGNGGTVDLEIAEEGERLFAGSCILTREDSGDVFTISAESEETGAFSLTGSRSAEETADVYSLTAESDGRRIAYLDGTAGKKGDVNFELHIPTYGENEMLAALTGTCDAQSGKGAYELSLSEVRSYPGSSVQSEQGAVFIETDRLKLNGDGTLSGSISAGIKRLNTEENPIPAGLKLEMNFGRGSVQIADNSAVYVTFAPVSDAAYLNPSEAKSRISDLWDVGSAKYLELVRGRYSGFGNNWNIAYPVNRLLDAGMPADFLKAVIPQEMSLEDIGGMMEDFLDDIF